MNDDMPQFQTERSPSKQNLEATIADDIVVVNDERSILNDSLEEQQEYNSDFCEYEESFKGKRMSASKEVLSEGGMMIS
jgi:hypothetical protein